MSNNHLTLPRSAEIALNKLAVDLKAAGYTVDEVTSIVEGAREHAEITYSEQPDLSDSDLVELVTEFDTPDPPPANINATIEKGGEVLFGWVGALGVIAAMFVLVLSMFNPEQNEEQAGAIFLTATIIGVMLGTVFGWMSRRTKTGKISLILAAFLFAFVVLAFALNASG